MRFALSLLIALLLMAAAEPLAAQVSEFPTDCTEAMSAGNVFIGHDCGEWASVLICGNIIIRKPWSRANRANLGVRLRLRREDGGAPVSEPADPLDAPTSASADPGDTPRAPETSECHPAYGGCLPFREGGALNCGDIGDQQVSVINPSDDPYGLDVNRGVGNDITCDDEA